MTTMVCCAASFEVYWVACFKTIWRSPVQNWFKKRGVNDHHTQSFSFFMRAWKHLNWPLQIRNISRQGLMKAVGLTFIADNCHSMFCPLIGFWRLKNLPSASLVQYWFRKYTRLMINYSLEGPEGWLKSLFLLFMFESHGGGEGSITPLHSQSIFDRSI